jgi:cytochrome c oxidase cbb3-type subunit 3
MFYGGIAFGIFYFVLYQIMGAPTLRDELKRDYAVIKELQDKFNQQNGTFDETKFQAILKDDGEKKGQLVFETNCVACHKEKGIGDIGPNLSDEYWLWAKGTPETIYPVVLMEFCKMECLLGRKTLSNEEIYQVVAYVQTLHNTNQPGGKAPQGNKVE